MVAQRPQPSNHITPNDIKRKLFDQTPRATLGLLLSPIIDKIEAMRNHSDLAPDAVGYLLFRINFYMILLLKTLTVKNVPELLRNENYEKALKETLPKIRKQRQETIDIIENLLKDPDVISEIDKQGFEGLPTDEVRLILDELKYVQKEGM